MNKLVVCETCDAIDTHAHWVDIIKIGNDVHPISMDLNYDGKTFDCDPLIAKAETEFGVEYDGAKMQLFTFEHFDLTKEQMNLLGYGEDSTSAHCRSCNGIL